MDLQQINIRITKETHLKLKQLALDKESSLQALVTGYIEDGLEKEEKINKVRK